MFEVMLGDPRSWGDAARGVRGRARRARAPRRCPTRRSSSPSGSRTCGPTGAGPRGGRVSPDAEPRPARGDGPPATSTRDREELRDPARGLARRPPRRPPRRGCTSWPRPRARACRATPSSSTSPGATAPTTGSWPGSPPTPTRCPVFPEYDLDRQFDTMAEVAARSSVPVPPLRGLRARPVPPRHRVPRHASRRRPGPVRHPAVLVRRRLAGGGVARRSGPDSRLGRSRCSPTCTRSPTRRRAFPWFAVDDDRSPLRAHVDAQRAYADWVLDGREGRLIDAGFAWLEAHWPADEGETVLSWGDARIGNIMFATSRPVAVLDWEMASLGPREVDLGWTIFLHRFFDDLALAFGLPGLPDFLRREDVAATYDAAHRGTRHATSTGTPRTRRCRHAIIMTRIGAARRSTSARPRCPPTSTTSSRTGRRSRRCSPARTGTRSERRSERPERAAPATGHRRPG